MTSLATEPCEPECNEVNEFLFTFIIKSFVLKNEDKYSGTEKQLTYTWDGNVIKSIAKDSVDEFIGSKQLIVYASPMAMFKKLRNSPIMLNLMIACDDLGTLKLPITHCFAEAVLCKDFESQQFINDFKFLRNEKVTATMEMDFVIQKVARESIAGILSAFDASNKIFQTNLKNKLKKQRGGNDDEADDDEGGEPCPEFACLNELPSHCKQKLELGEHAYKIINGHLINIRDKKGICGEACEVAKKYCKEYRKPTSASSSSPIDLNELFARKPTKAVCEEPSEESLNCDKFLQNPDMSKYYEKQMKKIDSNFDFGCGDGPCMISKKQKKRTKKSKVRNSPICPPLPIIPRDPQKTFVEKMKRKARGKYSYEFGNTYPLHRSHCSIRSNDDVENVPKAMGWRHDKVDLSNNKKWHPGQINNTVRLLMKHHLHPYPYDTLALSNTVRRNRLENHELCHEQSELETLQISKKNGEISFTMRPLKERKQLETDCNPYLNCTPLKFVLKKHPEEIKKHQARVIMKARGCMRKCACENIKLCRCLNGVEKKLLQIEMKRLSAELKMKTQMQFEDVYETSDSEIDFAFTPPSASNARHKCKADVAHTGMKISHFRIIFLNLILEIYSQRFTI